MVNETTTIEIKGDYSEDFPCPKCGGIVDVFINWNNGDEHARCRKGCIWDRKDYEKINEFLRQKANTEVKR